MEFPDIPESSGHYMKLQQGDNKIRMLDRPIDGKVYWTEDRKPVRKRQDEPVDFRIPGTDKIKYFWAFPVWNYAEESVQILELTQKTIMKEIRGISQDEDWGDPRFYDISITRSGDSLETKYSVVPKPKKKLSEEARGAWASVKDIINMEALFTGENPFDGGEKNEGGTVTTVTQESMDEEVNKLHAESNKKNDNDDIIEIETEEEIPF